MGNLFSKKKSDDTCPDYFSDDVCLQIDQIINKFKDKPLVYDNIIMSGGGLKGISYAGSLLVMNRLIDAGVIVGSDGPITDLHDLKGFGGTSFGSIITTLLAVGYTSEELYETIYKLDFGEFDDKNTFVGADLYNMFNNFGICPGKKFEDKIAELIAVKTNDENYTFGDLYNKRGKTLVLVGTDMTAIKPVYFSHQTFPDLPIKVGIRISASLPFLFQPKIIQTGPLQTYYIDGGVLDNYPIHAYDNEKFGSIYENCRNIKDYIRNNDGSYNKKTIGLRILDKKYESLENKDYILQNSSITNFSSFTTAFFNVLLYGEERFQMINGYWERTISVETEYIPFTQLSVDYKTKQQLISDGIKGVLAYYKELQI